MSERTPEAAAVLLLRRSGPPQDEPPWPGRHRWGLHAAVLPSRIVVTAMRSIDTEGPPRNGVCREMNHDAAHGFESKARLS